MIPSQAHTNGGGAFLTKFLTGQITGHDLTESMFEDLQLDWIHEETSKSPEYLQGTQHTNTPGKLGQQAMPAFAPIPTFTNPLDTQGVAPVQRKQAAFKPIKVTNNQRELEMLKNSTLYNREEMMQVENPTLDKKGPMRQWKNWEQKGIDPTRASVITWAKVDPLLPGPPPPQEGATDPAFQDPTFAEQYKVCSTKGEKFRDHRFPAEPISIIGTEQNYPPQKDKLVQAAWNRPEVWFGSNKFEVFNSVALGPNSVKQGELGDCYLLAPLSSLALKPERIKRIVKVRKVNNFGIYMVSFCLHGVWENIIVDDRIPCFKGGDNSPIFATSTNKEIWVGIVEKAWAKIHFGYLNIESGTIEESMHALTGAPVVHHVLSETAPDEKTWEHLWAAPRKNYAIAASSRDLKNAQVDKKGVDLATGLVRSHAYSVTASYEIRFDNQGHPAKILQTEAKNPNNLRLVRLRNPWAGTEWKGAWSDNDPRWTPDLISLVGWSRRDDGVFWMNYQDFCRYFNSFVVCEVKDENQFSGIKLETDDEKPTILKFVIKKEGTYNFSLNQLSKRMFRKESQYTYSACSLLIARVGSQGIVYNKGFNHAMSQLVHVREHCEAGNYVAYICTPWRRDVNQIGFEIYGPDYIPSITHSTEEEIPFDFMGKFMLDHAKKRIETERKTFKDLRLPEIGYMTHITPSGMGYILFENKSQDVQLTAMLKFSDPQNTVFYPPASDESRIELVVVPGKMKLVVFRMTKPESGFSYQQSVSFDPQYTKICQNIESKGQITSKLLNGQDCGIYMKECKFSNGSGYLFVNNSKALEFKEKVEFVLKNARLTGDDNSVYVKLRPGKKRLVMVTADDAKKPWTIQLKPGHYEVSPMSRTILVSYAAEFK